MIRLHSSGIGVTPEPAEPVDCGRDHQVAGDHEPDRRRDPDLRRGECDREDDERAQDPAEPHPQRLVKALLDAREAAASDEQDEDAGRPGDERREPDRLDRPDLVPEPAEDRGLHGACEPSRQRHHDRECTAARHAPTLLGCGCSRPEEAHGPRVRPVRGRGRSGALSAPRRAVRPPDPGHVPARQGLRGRRPAWSSATGTTPSSSSRTRPRSRRSPARPSSRRQARTQPGWAFRSACTSPSSSD